MDFFIKRNWAITKEIASEIKRNWNKFRSLTTRGDKIKMFTFLYMSAVFLMAFLASWYVSALFVILGIVMGLYLGITDHPGFFALLLLPLVGIITLKLTQLYWTRFYPEYRKEFFNKMNL
ncbi:hypothetical protein SAMN04488127_0013 [Bhargavaea ginsengi]|uniref:Uncharacterized protein n=1 Tax=Bhargavaea ginsengi TaxID=426757 RepID=A0A1H6S3I1_9BACL|nr:hypothetical protein [Bhargavaea ginsengi]SEI62698.1 hypothetical protein SAMN04488127_0013 [Bhargavaea ginsengi]